MHCFVFRTFLSFEWTGQLRVEPSNPGHESPGVTSLTQQTHKYHGVVRGDGLMLPLRLPVVLSVFLAAATAQSTIVTLDCPWFFACFLTQLTRSISDGVFTGVNDSSTNIVSFKGIRYANPPVGDNRWRAPVFPPSQVGSVNASSVRCYFLFVIPSFTSLLVWRPMYLCRQWGFGRLFVWECTRFN